MITIIIETLEQESISFDVSHSFYIKLSQAAIRVAKKKHTWNCMFMRTEK